MSVLTKIGRKLHFTGKRRDMLKQVGSFLYTAIISEKKYVVFLKKM